MVARGIGEFPLLWRPVHAARAAGASTGSTSEVLRQPRPADHGARIVGTVLNDPQLNEQW